MPHMTNTLDNKTWLIYNHCHGLGLPYVVRQPPRVRGSAEKTKTKQQSRLISIIVLIIYDGVSRDSRQRQSFWHLYDFI